MIVQNQKSTHSDQESGNAKRDNYCIAFIGTNRTGKTSIAQQMARQWKKNNPGKKVVAFDPQLKFREIADDFIFGHDKNWGEGLKKLRNCLLILDDYRLLHQNNRCSPELFELLNFRAAWNVDIIYITHSPALVLNQLTYYTTYYFIFYTLSQSGSFEKKIPAYHLCINASKYVNKYVKYFGKGTYPDFPYIIVDVQNEELKTQNMDKNKFLLAYKNEKKPVGNGT